VADRGHHRRHDGILVWLPTIAQAGITAGVRLNDPATAPRPGEDRWHSERARSRANDVPNQPSDRHRNQSPSTPKEVNHDTSCAYVAARSHHHRYDRHPRLVAHDRPGGHYGEGRRLNGTRCRTAPLPAGAAHPHEIDSARAHETQLTPYNVRTMSSIAGSSKVRSTTSVTALTSARTLAAVVSLGLKASRCRWPSRSLPI
jgi:hypothetical protein